MTHLMKPPFLFRIVWLLQSPVLPKEIMFDEIKEEVDYWSLLKEKMLPGGSGGRSTRGASTRSVNNIGDEDAKSQVTTTKTTTTTTTLTKITTSIQRYSNDIDDNWVATADHNDAKYI